jgi:anti-sigma regulatory factor (Ser/Thr protein kinase)
LVAEFSLQIAGGPNAPSAARSALRRAHPELPIELMQVIALLASELVSNAVRHGRAKSVGLRVDVLPKHVRVDVTDQGPGFARRIDRPDPSGVGGWGLHLVDELSTRWGIVGGKGARVWFEIER